jgi:hypothetical protein
MIGVSDHGGWAVLVTVARDGTLLDRRWVELVGEGLPKLPHHSEGQGLPLDEAVELVERVRVSAKRHAVLALDAVTMTVSRILGLQTDGSTRRALQPPLVLHNGWNMTNSIFGRDRALRPFQGRGGVRCISVSLGALPPATIPVPFQGGNQPHLFEGDAAVTACCERNSG